MTILMHEWSKRIAQSFSDGPLAGVPYRERCRAGSDKGASRGIGIIGDDRHLDLLVINDRQAGRTERMIKFLRFR